MHNVIVFCRVSFLRVFSGGWYSGEQKEVFLALWLFEAFSLICSAYFNILTAPLFCSSQEAWYEFRVMAVMDDMVSEPSNVVGVSSTGKFSQDATFCGYFCILQGNRTLEGFCITMH